MENLTFKDKNNEYIVKLDIKIYQKILEHCNNANQYETGGIIVGRYSTDCSTAIINEIIMPKQSLKLRRFEFFRNNNGIKKQLDSLWDKELYYLGEWHYHPNSEPIPSNTDIEQMHKLSKYAKLFCPEAILVIIGGFLEKRTINVSIYHDNKQIKLDKIN